MFTVCQVYLTNVANVEEVKELNENISRELGAVDILVNNAGLVQADHILSYSEEAIRTIMAVNLFSHFWVSRSKYC